MKPVLLLIVAGPLFLGAVNGYARHGATLLPVHRSNYHIDSKRTVSQSQHRKPMHLDMSKVKLAEPFAKGIKSDLSRKAKHYISDFTDGFSIKSLSSAFFLFFACLSPAVAYGSVLTFATGGAMGTMEAVGATAIGGILYALFSAQPLTIIGTTGPLLAFLKVLYESCQAHGVPFLPVYSWVGIWSSAMLFLSAAFSMSNFVEYITKFTDDIFSMLTSIIFISGAVRDIATAFISPAVSDLQACVSLISASTTYLAANTLCALRQTPFLPRRLRSKIADFAPTIGVLTGIKVALMAEQKYNFVLPSLAVPEFLTTTSGRPWLVDIFSVPMKLRLLCFFPALMATVLLFMDQNITVHLIMSKKNKLKKGSGVHLDMLVISVITLITSMLGMPWMVGATVRSLAHLESLKQYDTLADSPAPDNIPPSIHGSSASSSIRQKESEENEEEEVLSTTRRGGGARTALMSGFTGVQENRLTGLLIHSLIGAAVLFCRPILRMIPTSALTGVFLYMRISSIRSTELFTRSLLFITDTRDAPKSEALEKVGVARTKLFTLLQLALLGSIWWVKSTRLGVFFPVLIGLLAPIRIAIEKWRVFDKKELDVLDDSVIE